MKDYLATIAAVAATGQATEHSYRAAVEGLFHRLYPQLEITNEPRRQKCGAPDFVVQRHGVPLGYIEAKDLGKDLSADEYKEQFGRYRRSLDNLLITDYLHWQLWQRGELVLEARIGDYAKGQAVKARPQDYPAFAELLQAFVSAQGQRIGSAETLAQLMADKARLLQYVLLQALTHPEVQVSPSGLTTATAGSLESQYAAFRQMLIHDLTHEQFADIYAQTIAYGLFAARLHDATPDTFSRQEALSLVPASNPFLRKLFSYVAGTDLDERVVWIVDALAELFRQADVAALLAGFGQQTQMTDPFLYFYETFLGRYNPALKKSRGVYYTPQPVVRFIVRAVDEVLRRDFGLAEGLADTATTTVDILVPEIKNGKATGKDVKAKREVARVQVLDPATGTGTFLAEVVRHIHATTGGGGFWNQYVDKHLIPRLHGFEIMMASYAMCHLKLGLLLEQLGYKPNPTPPRLSVYLTNALEEAHPDSHTLFASWLSDEAREANTIKRDAPVMVILGNPPYSSSSTNKGEWILNLIQDYKRGLNERKINLDDDYIKFIRYAEHFIEKNGQGIIAFIANNSFLDGITHRHMRKHLLDTFDSIYIIDLHGNAKKKEKSPDGSKDENVFDIQQGVAIFIFVKKPNSDNKLTELYQYDLYGSREHKYHLLESNSLETIKWCKLAPQVGSYFFFPVDIKDQVEYDSGISLGELFPTYNSGVKTDRDPLFIDLDKGPLEQRMRTMLDEDYSEDFKNEFRVYNSGSFNLTERLKNKSFSAEYMTNIQYRIFDSRPIYYDKEIISRPGQKASKHIFNRDNIGLIFKRQAKDDGTSYSYAFVSEHLIIDGLFAIDPKGREVIAPLYLYPDTGDLYATEKRRPNLKPEAVARLAQATGLTFVPEATEAPGTFAPVDVLDYVYGVLHQPAYRRRYHELLRIDFPRVPLPASAAAFGAVVAYGRQLRELHLLRPAALPVPLPTRTGGEGPGTVEKPRYDAATQRVYFNASQYVEPVAPAVWAFPIGGYQPAQKWLKDRQGRSLSYEESRHYQRLLAALEGTERLMREWDEGHAE
ncbi:MAG TPA: type ISP restriction/modification enzyme [Hymenobacter sp.]|uniref:type ISP restriction/modification enzyme n=1 Tax=Hymenobacter sp. TaxID=1898978 RepID=UPI002D7E7500|nr:type ISP restriction/modification enzyme [Hymenobacter sp.]HET9502411.1 type ISP restriction/modification enzyme [Hymenobacter sp.]